MNFMPPLKCTTTYSTASAFLNCRLYRAGQQCSIPTPPFTQSTLFASHPNFPSLHFVSPNICLSHKSRIPKCFLPLSNFLYALASSPAPRNHKFKATEKMWCYKKNIFCCFQYILYFWYTNIKKCISYIWYMSHINLIYLYILQSE